MSDQNDKLSTSENASVDIKQVESFLLGDVLLFLLVVSWFIEIQIIGRIFLVEFIFAGIAVGTILNKKSRESLPPLLRKILFFAIIWLLAQILSDVYQATPFEDYARGWAKISFFAMNVVAIYQMTKNSERRVLLFIIAFAVGELLGLIWFPNVYFEAGRVWKFGYAMPLATLLILLSSKSRFRLLPVLVLASLSVLNLFLDYRSLAGFCMVAALITLYSMLNRSRKEEAIRRIAFIKIFKNIAWSGAAILLIIGFVVLYQYSEEFELGTQLGSEWARYGVDRNPLYGRIEFFVGLQAAMDSPLIGHGSWAKDISYALLAQALAVDVGKSTGPVLDELIPTHSYFVGAWVEAGLVGALFWLYIFFHSIRALVNSVNVVPHLVAIISFYLVGFLWAVPFSPFGASTRITAAINIILVNFILAKSQSKTK